MIWLNTIHQCCPSRQGKTEVGVESVSEYRMCQQIKLTARQLFSNALGLNWHRTLGAYALQPNFSGRQFEFDVIVFGIKNLAQESDFTKLPQNRLEIAWIQWVWNLMTMISMLNASSNRFSHQRQFSCGGAGLRYILLRIKNYTSVPLIETPEFQNLTPEFYKISTRLAGNYFKS